jgi:uncharacterized protein YfdQ (DUF2303 family)
MDKNMDTISHTDIQAAIDAGKAIGQPVQPLDEETVVIIPANYKVEALEKIIAPYLPMPRRIKANVTLTNAESFIRYVAAYKSPWTRIFAAIPNGNAVATFQAILDYHSSANDDLEEIPQWCEHRATYQPAFTPEWKRWFEWDRKKMDQLEFATFLEENQLLVVEPIGAALLELVTTLEGKNDIRCSSLMRLANGRQKLTYEEDVTLKGTTTTQQGQVDFPTQLVAGIAPFDGGPTYSIRCRLKYRIPNRRLEFWFETVDTHLVLKDAANGIVAAIQEKLEIVPLLGFP